MIFWIDTKTNIAIVILIIALLAGVFGTPIALQILSEAKETVIESVEDFEPVIKAGTEKTAVVNWMLRRSDIPKDVLAQIYDTAQVSKYPDLVLSIIHRESNFNPYAISKNIGARGLMQVRWEIWGPELKKAGIANNRRDLFDIEINILAGEFVLERYLKTKGTLRKALYYYVGQSDSYEDKVLTSLADIYLTRQYFKIEQEKYQEEIKNGFTNKVDIWRVKESG